MKLWKSTFRMKTRTKAVLCLTSVVTLVSVGGISTYAGYTDNGSSQIIASAGTIKLSIGTVNSKYFSYSLGTLWPEYPIPDKNLKIMNTGTAPMKYNIKITTTALTELDKTLDVTIKNGSITLYQGKVAYVDTVVQTIPGQGNHDLTWSFVWPKNDDSVDNKLAYTSFSSNFSVNATS